jgi:hypothetical protein
MALSGTLFYGIIYHAEGLPVASEKSGGRRVSSWCWEAKHAKDAKYLSTTVFLLVLNASIEEQDDNEYGTSNKSLL